MINERVTIGKEMTKLIEKKKVKRLSIVEYNKY